MQIIAHSEWAAYPRDDTGLLDNMEYLSEFMAYDALSPLPGNMAIGDNGKLGLQCEPTPLHWSRQVECPWALKQADVQSHHRCLDVGASGPFAFAIARRCKELVSIDCDKELVARLVPALDRAKAHYRDGTLDGMWCAVTRAEQLPFPDAHFDRVFCVSVFEHIPELADRQRALAEFVRVMKPGAVLLLTMDVVIEGAVGNGNFYVSKHEAFFVCHALGVPPPKAHNSVAARTFNKEGTTVAALMISVTKPGDE